MTTIKNRLKILRTDEGITQDKLAEIINEKLKEIFKIIEMKHESHDDVERVEKLKQIK